MAQHYKLDKLEILADGDQDFISQLVTVFLEEVPTDAEQLKVAAENKDYYKTYQTAHKMKPTVDLFELGVLDNLIEIQDWGKFEKKDLDISYQLTIVLKAIQDAITEIKSDFNH